jgi:hypothetical protein
MLRFRLKVFLRTQSAGTTETECALEQGKGSKRDMSVEIG